MRTITTILTVVLLVFAAAPALGHHRPPTVCQDFWATSLPRSPLERMTSLPVSLQPDPRTGCLSMGPICVLDWSRDTTQATQQHCLEGAPGHQGVSLAIWCQRLDALPLPSGYTSSDFRPHCPAQWLRPLAALPADIRQTLEEAPGWVGPGRAARLRQLSRWIAANLVAEVAP